MSKIDWNKVKAYYLTCHSYKMTGEQFNVSPCAVKNRAIRGKWVAEVAKNATSAQDLLPLEVGKGEDLLPQEVARQDHLIPHEVARQEKVLPPEVATEPEMIPLQVAKVEKLLPHEWFPMLPALPNLMAQQITFVHPWKCPVKDRSSLSTKATYHTYISAPDSRDCLFSGIAGHCRNLRLGRENPPATMLAIVADYDMVLSEEKRAKLLDKLKIKPNLISRSYSGGTHAVWLLEKPLPLIPDAELLHALLKLICKELKLANAFGPLDERAFFNPHQYYHAGWEWKIIEHECIPESRSLRWFMDVLNKARWGKSGLLIPIERVRQEVESRFPGRWQGEFSVGARGVRFWDATADNPSAAIVTEHGMVCFTGPHAWRSWADIFGVEFIDKYRDDTLGQSLKECFFVGNSFYVLTHMRNPDGSLVPTWQQLNRQNVEGLIALKYNVSTRAEKGDKQSEAKKILSEIIRVNSMAAALPLIYRPETTIMLNGSPVLNTSFLRVHPPDDTTGKSWAAGFPWTAAFLETLFPDVIQRERFLAAWAYAYRNAYAGHPRNGHVLFIAGEPGVGKNFLTECLYGPSLGGYVDASEYLLARTRFNDGLFNVGVWTCNDSVTKGDAQERTVFARMLKKMSANVRHVWEGKYKQAASLDWSGRVCVTLNTDPMSLAILPDIDINNKDKVSLFRTSAAVMNEPQAVVFARQEMGALCSFLLHWEFPQHCIGDARWGVRNFLHPELLAEATNSGSTAAFRDILALFAQSMFEADGRLALLEGSATWFLQQMLEQDSLKEMLRGTVSATSIGKRMSALANSGVFPLTYVRSCTQRIWRIERASFEVYLKQGMEEEVSDEICPF